MCLFAIATNVTAILTATSRYAYLYLCVDNVHERRLQARSANQEAIDISLRRQLAAVLLAHAAAINDARALRRLRADSISKPLANRLVHLLRLLRRRHLARANGPDRLIRNDNLAPVLDLVGHSAQLRRHDLDRLIGLALLQRLAAAQHHAQPVLQRVRRLGCNKGVALAQDLAPLRVAQDRPRDVAVDQLLDGDFAGEGALGLVEDVLCSDFQAGLEVFAREEQVQSWRGDDDLCRVCQSMLIALA